MKKILIVGGSHSDIPIIRSAKEQGLYVYTAGNSKEDYGHKFSDKHVEIDYCDKDSIIQFVMNENIDFICPSCNDFSYITSSYVANKLNMPGNYDDVETTLTMIHKDRFRKFCNQNMIDSPRAKGFGDVSSAIQEVKSWSFPLISKPADFCGGRGVAKVEKKEDLLDAIEDSLDNSRQKRVVVEEFMEGSNHGFSSIIKDQKIIFGFFDNEIYYKNQFRVSGAYHPSEVPQAAKDKIIKECEKIARILDLKDGIFHVQFILKPSSDAVIIEVTRRPPGDLYVDLVEKVTGLKYADYLLRCYTGQDTPDLMFVESGSVILRHCIMSERDGVIKDVKFDDTIKDKVIDKLIIGKVGDIISDYMTYKYGIAFIKFESLGDLENSLPRIQELIKIEIINH